MTDFQDSFQNYIDLFNRIIELAEDGNSSFTLPAAWVWDIINSFVNQFMDFQHHIAEQGTTSEKTSIWEVQSVMKYLHFLALQAGFVVNEPVSDEIRKAL